MKSIAYCVYREDEFYVAQCLNVDVSSFGDSRDDAVRNLTEAVELYFEDQGDKTFVQVDDLSVGEQVLNA